MDEATKVLEFFSIVQKLALNPETYSLDSDSLNNRYTSLIKHESPKKALNSKDDQKVKTSVTYAIFGSDDSANQHAGIQNNLKSLKLCKLHPDELLQRWRTRMAAINCLKNDKSIDSLMEKFAAQQTSGIASNDFVKNTSVLLGISEETLLQQHTLSSFFNTLEGLRPSTLANVSIKHREAYQRNEPFRIGNKHLKYCTECAAKDLSSLGYSYWRCSHQIPGVLWCSEHDNLLSIHNKTINLKSPHQLSESNKNNEVLSLSQGQIKILKKYTEMAYRVFNYGSSIDSGAASVALGNQARLKNLRISKPGIKITPSTMLLNVLPKWWLEDTFPRVKWISNKYMGL